MLRLSSALRSLHPVCLCALVSSGVLFAGRNIPTAPGDPIVPDEVLVKLEPGFSVAAVASAAGSDVSVVASNRTNSHVLRLKGVIPAAWLETLARRADVIFIERNHIRTTQLAVPNDPNFASQWALATVRAVEAWNLVPATSAVFGPRLKVAVLDTGTDCTHPDFRGTSGSVDSRSGGQLNLIDSAAAVATTVSAPACAWQDDHGHGTHVAGTIAASTWNATGVASLGYPLEIMTYKVLNSSGSGSDYTIANAIMAAVDAGARIVSMSLGGPGYSQTLQDAIDYAWQRNVLVVVAAGNSNSSSLHFPAGANHAVAVAATDPSGAKASYSNYGMALALAAPGSGILSTYPVNKGGYATMSGTSMATPHVSALAGLIAATSPGAATESILQRMQQTALANTGWNQILGYGVINAFGAVAGIATSATSGSIVGQVLNSGEVPLAGAVVSAGGLSVTTNEAGVFRIAGLSPGAYFLNVNGSSAGSLAQNVNVVAGADSPVSLRLGVPIGLIRGTITSGGSPVPGAVAWVVAGGLRTASVIAGAAGDFEVSVPAGTYELRGSALGYAEATGGMVSVAAGVQISRSIALARYGSIQGMARNSSGAPVVGATISLSGPVLAGAVSTAAGQLSTIGLPPGQYTATCSAKDQEAPPSFTVVVANDAVTAADCQFGSATLTVTPAAAFVPSGGQTKFTALLNTVATSAVTWSRSPAIGTLDAAGLFTAPVGLMSNQTLTVTASSTALSGLSASAAVTVGPAIVLTLSPAEVVGGNPATGRVRVGEPAAAGGQMVTLTSSNPQVASVPPSILIPAGATESSPFAIATSGVAGTASVVITAAVSGGSSAAALTVNPAAISSVSVSPSPLTAGANASAQVSLTGQAPPGGAVVSVVSSNPAVLSVPSDVTVGAGQSYVTFSATSSSVSGPATVAITATRAGVSKTVSVTVVPAALQSVTLVASSMPSGTQQSANRVNLAAPAPAGGLVVALASSSPQLTVPSSVTVSAGATYALFTASAAVVDNPVPVTVTATVDGVSKSAGVTVVPAFVRLLSVSASITGGVGPGGTVYLTGIAGASGVAVSLTSSDPSILTVPAQVVIGSGAGSAVFPYTSKPVTSARAVLVTATTGAISVTATVNVVPATITSIGFAYPSIASGTTQNANRISLTGPAPEGGLAVALSTTSPEITVPPVVVVPEGVRNFYFTLTFPAVDAPAPISMTATVNGVAKNASATIVPATLSYISFPTQITGATGATGRVNLTGVAGPSGASVVLTSSTPGVLSVPAAVAVPPGGTTATFPMNAGEVTSPVVASVTASLNASVRSLSVTVAPPVISAVALSPATVKGGSVTTFNRIYLNAAAPAGGLTVLLTSANGSLAAVPASVTVPQGQSSASFAVMSSPVAANTPLTIMAATGGKTVSATLTLTP